MIAKLFTGALLLLSAACAASPVITSRPISGDATGAAWFVRLDTVQDSRASAESRFEHPATLSESDLAEILRRVHTQARIGLMDATPSPQPLFSSHDLRRLVPSIQQALRTASPSEWVTFYSAGPTVISGGLFLRGGRLHVVVANHHDPPPAEPGSLDLIRANPLSPWKGQRLTPSFDPARFVTETRTAWMAGSTGAPAGELILRHQAFLAFLADRPERTEAPALVTPALPPSLPQPMPSSQAVSSPPPPDAGDGALHEPRRGLHSDMERLQRRLDEQDDDIAKLKTRLFDLELFLKNQQGKKPPH